MRIIIALITVFPFIGKTQIVTFNDIALTEFINREDIHQVREIGKIFSGREKKVKLEHNLCTCVFQNRKHGVLITTYGNYKSDCNKKTNVASIVFSFSDSLDIASHLNHCTDLKLVQKPNETHVKIDGIKLHHEISKQTLLKSTKIKFITHSCTHYKYGKVETLLYSSSSLNIRFDFNNDKLVLFEISIPDI